MQKLYVGWTRVTDSKYLRFWPGTDEQLKLERFLSFTHNMELVLLDQAYDEDGLFKDELYKAAYNRY